MTRVFYCSTFFGAVTLSAAIDAGCFGPHIGRRLLIIAANSPVPEVTSRVDETPGWETLAPRFDDVIFWNEVIAPLHPSSWSPGAAEVPMLARLISVRLGLDDVHELIVESLSVAPARTIARLIRDCPITVFSDGLMSYGPTRDALPSEIGGRVQRVLYLDLVPSLEPLLLREFGAVCEAVPDLDFAEILAGLPCAPGAEESRGCPVIVGQYLSALGIMSPSGEAELHADMLRALVARGHQRVAFKPHPTAGTMQVQRLRAAAQEVGVALSVVPESVSAETWFRDARPELVVSCFSTALLTAAHYFGLDVATMGCSDALERVAPYENSNRIPATIVGALVPQLNRDGSVDRPRPVEVVALVRAVGYCMQSRRHPDLREDAAQYLLDHGPAVYFKRRRLEAIGLVRAPVRRSAMAAGSRRLARRLIARAGRHGAVVVPRRTAKAISRLP